MRIVAYLRTLFVGIITVLLLVLVILTVVRSPGGRFQIHARFANVNGLLPGSLVRYRGVTIGRVVNVSLAEREGSEAACVRVTLGIDEQFRTCLRSTSAFMITSTSVIGDKGVEVEDRPSPAGKEAELLEDGAEVTGETPKTIADITRDLGETSDTLKKLFAENEAGIDLMLKRMADVVKGVSEWWRKLHGNTENDW